MAALLIAVLLWGPLRILYENQRPPSMPVQHRLGWNLKNVSRLDGNTPGAVSVAASRARFPDPARIRPRIAVVLTGDDPAFALAAAPLAAPPLNAVLLVQTPADAAVVQAEVARLGVREVLPFGPGTPGNADPAAVAATVGERVARARGGVTERVILLDAGRAGEMLPLIPWLALSGDVMLFSRDGRLPPETRAALARLGRVRALYRGPSTPEVPEGTAALVRDLPAFQGDRGAVRFAEYHDEVGGLGWDYDRDRLDGYHQYILAREGDWKSAFGASTLAPANRTPLLWTGKDALAGATEAYLWEMKPTFYDSPAEGPFDHAWIAGGLDRISFGAQARSDLALEVQQYRTKGEAGASALELLLIGWMVLSLSLALWVTVHVLRRMPGLHWTMKWGWPLLVLVTGPVGFWMYLSLYRRRPRTDMEMEGEPMGMWYRGFPGQVGAATAMGVAFDMPLMVVTSYLVAAFGEPPIIFNGPLYWLGISMVVAMLIAYVVPLLVATLCYEAPMQMMYRKVGYAEALRYSWVPMGAAMTAGWVGMMGSMAWLHMFYPAGMGMPEEDEVRWWGFVLLAVLVGVLFEWVVNFWLVKTGRRPGTM